MSDRTAVEPCLEGSVPLITTDNGKDFCHSIDGSIPYGRADFLAAEFLSYNLMGGTQTVWTGYSDDSLRTFQRAADYGWKLSYIHIMGPKDQTNISRDKDNNRILQHVLLDWLSGQYKIGPFTGGCNFWRVYNADQLEIELQLRPPYPTAYPLFQNEGGVDGDYVCASALKGSACERLQRVETSFYAKLMKTVSHPLCGWDFPIDAMLEETTGVFDMGAHWFKYDLSPHCKLVPVSVDNLEYRSQSSSDGHGGNSNTKLTQTQTRPRGLARHNPNNQYVNADRKAFATKGRKISGHIMELSISDQGDRDKNANKTSDETQQQTASSGRSRKQILQKHYQKIHLEQFEHIVSIAVLDGEVYDMGLQLKPSIGGCSVEDELDLSQNIIPMIQALSAKLRKEVDNYHKTCANSQGNTMTGKRSKFIRELGKDKVMLKELTTILNSDLSLQNNKLNNNATSNSMTNIDLLSRIPNFSNLLSPWLVANMKLWYHNKDTVNFNLNLNHPFFPDYHLASYKICRHKNIGRYGPVPLPINSEVMKLTILYFIPLCLSIYYCILNIQFNHWGFFLPFTPVLTGPAGNLNERERSMNFRFPRKSYYLYSGVPAFCIMYFLQYLFPGEIVTKLLRLRSYGDLVEIPNTDGKYSESINNINNDIVNSDNHSTINNSNSDTNDIVNFGYSRYEYLSVVSAPTWITIIIFIQPAFNGWCNSWRKKFEQPLHYFEYLDAMSGVLFLGGQSFLATVIIGVYIQDLSPQLFVYYVALSFAGVESLFVAAVSKSYNNLAYAGNFRNERFCGGEGMERLPDNTVVVPESDIVRDKRLKQDNQTATQGPGSESSATVMPIQLQNSDSKTANDPTEEEALSDVAKEQANEQRDKFKSLASNQWWYVYLFVYIIHQSTESAKLILLMYQAYNNPKGDIKVFQSLLLSSVINVINRLGIPRVIGVAILPSEFLKWFCLPTPILKTHDYVKFSGGWNRFMMVGCLFIIRGITYEDWSIFDERNYKYDENGNQNNQYDPEQRKFTSWCLNGNVLYAFIGSIIAEFIDDTLVGHFMKNSKINSISATVIGKTYFEVMPIDIDVEVTGDLTLKPNIQGIQDVKVNTNADPVSPGLDSQDTDNMNGQNSKKLMKFQRSNFHNESAKELYSNTNSESVSATNKTSNSGGEVSKDEQKKLDAEQKKIDEEIAALDTKIWQSKQLMDIYSPDLLFCKRKQIPISVTTVDIGSLSQARDVNVVKEIVAEMPQSYRQRFQNTNSRQSGPGSNSDDVFGDLLALILRRFVSLTAHGRRCLADDYISPAHDESKVSESYQDSSANKNNTHPKPNHPNRPLNRALGFGPCPLLQNCRLFSTQRGGPLGFFLTTHSYVGVWQIFIIIPGLLFGWDTWLGTSPVYSTATWYRFEQALATWTTIEVPDHGEGLEDWQNVWSRIFR